MSYTPHKALRLGAEALNKYPVVYDKTRLSGSNKVTYILHSKGACMPGQKLIFTTSSTSKPKLDLPLDENQINSAFKNEKEKSSKSIIGKVYASNNLNNYTYDKFSPNDDENLEFVINASFRHMFGNIRPMESEVPVDLIRRLRNGDITVKEFIRQTAKSHFYKQQFFYNVSKLDCIKFNIKHILGRGSLSQDEIVKNIEIINRDGFNAQVDYLIDSKEYISIFGDNSVPYMRCWDSPCNSKTSDFINTIKITKSFASSDNSI
tara:strand:- start:89 stop:877 length:789 start_codon:yes stop_codon:yes gene_type:complete